MSFRYKIKFDLERTFRYVKIRLGDDFQILKRNSRDDFRYVNKIRLEMSFRYVNKIRLGG